MAKTALELHDQAVEREFDAELQRNYVLDIRNQFNAAVACLLRETGKSIEEVSRMVAEETARQRSPSCVSEASSSSPG